MQAEVNPQELLSKHVVLVASEVAAVLRVSVNTLRSMIKSGRGPQPLDNRRKSQQRWSAASLKRWLEEGGTNV